jgi:hypothetical protein
VLVILQQVGMYYKLRFLVIKLYQSAATKNKYYHRLTQGPLTIIKRPLFIYLFNAFLHLTILKLIILNIAKINASNRVCERITGTYNASKTILHQSLQ